MFDFYLQIRCDRSQKTSKPAHRQKHCLVERYTVFRQIACGLLIIPLKLEHAKYLRDLAFDFTGLRGFSRRSGGMMG